MKVLVNGQLIEYRKEGVGKAVLLLHGWGTSLASFDRLAKHLVETGHQVFRFDFPGFGASPIPESDWFVSDYAQLTADFVEKMKIDSLQAVFGHSFGGRVIIKGVATGLLKPQKIVLLASAGVKPKTTAKKAAFQVIAKTGKVVTALPGLRSVGDKLRNKLYASAGSTDYLNSGPLQKIFLNTINEDLVGYLGDIRKPTLMVWGEHDTETPVADAKLMKQTIPNAKLVVLPQAGHFVYDDDFAGVIRAVDGFIG